MPGPGTILELVPSARTGRSHSTGERPLTSDEPSFGKAATDVSSNDPAPISCAACSG